MIVNEVCNGDGWAERWGVMEMGGPRDGVHWRWVGQGIVYIADGWAEKVGVMEMGGPRKGVHRRWVGRGIVYIIDGWAEERCTSEMGGPRDRYTLEMGGPRDSVHRRRVGRGIVYIGGWKAGVLMYCKPVQMLSGLCQKDSPM